MIVSKMRKLSAIIIAPLLVLMLSSFTFSGQQDQRSSDSTKVNVTFTPAQIVVKDSRSTDAVTSLIKANTESNVEFAIALDKVAEVLKNSLNLQERRCASYMDRITSQTGLSVNEVNKIVHKKRVYDITFYTLFTVCLLYFLYGFITFNNYASAISMKEWGIKALSYILILLLLYLCYLAIGNIINGPNYFLIQAIINSPPG